MQGKRIIKKAPNTSLQFAKLLADFANSDKAGKIMILDMRKVVNFCDFFVLCSGNSTRHVQAIAKNIEDRLAEYGLDVRFKQGLREGRWVVIDFGTLVVHVFEKETRDFYGLDYLWQEAKVVDWEPKN